MTLAAGSRLASIDLSQAGALPDLVELLEGCCLDMRQHGISILFSRFFESQTTLGEMAGVKFPGDREKRCSANLGARTMANPELDSRAAEALRLNTHAFLLKEWPYLLVLILALSGVAYTSFSGTPITKYWISSGAFHRNHLCYCAVARRRKPRAALASRLDAGASLGCGARRDAPYVRSRRRPHDERRCERACRVDDTSAGDIHCRRSYNGMAHLSDRGSAGARRPRHRLARAIGASAASGRRRHRSGRCTIFLARQTGE